MTEYDYSPAAYERYIAQQTRVSDWIRETNRHAWSNPFLLSPTPRDRSFYDTPDVDSIFMPRSGGPTRSRTLRSQEGYESTSSSSRPSRSRTRVPTYADQSRQLDHRERELRQPPSRHRSQSHSRTPPSQSTIQTAYPQRTTQSYSYPQHHVTSGSHPHYYRNPGPAVYPYPTGRGSTPPRTAYTAPPPGHVYYPSHGGQPYNQSRDQLHRGYPQSRQPSRNQPPSYHTVPASGPKPENRRAPHIHAPIPTRPPQSSQPLLKRLFGFMTPAPVSHHRRDSSRGPRRSSY